MDLDLDIARQTAAAPPRRFALGMSGRLLLLTVGFVMLAQLLIFAPSAADFRRGWLEERLQAAQLASLAVEAAPDRLVNNALAADLLSGAGVAAVAIKRDGVRELVLNAAPPGAAAEFTVDMRKETWAQALAQTARAFFPAPESYMRIVGDPRAQEAQFVEALVPQAPLAEALRAHSARFFGASLVLSLIVGVLIYVTLNLVLVRPIRRLTAAMAAFGAAPERAAPPPLAALRRDELGEAQSALADMQRGLSQALRQKQRLAALGEGVSRISHDLRNVLSSASLISDRLAAEEDPRVRDLGARILRSINRAAGLCEATLRYGGAGDTVAHPRPLKLAAALDDAAQECCAGRLEWANSVDPDLAVCCDPEHLHRIALNLFRNAEAAMRGRPDPCLSVSVHQVGTTIRIHIVDTGPGLSDKALARLFQPFSGSGRDGGSGLGLAISRDLARANGGELRLSRSDASGAVFELELPAA